jgi:ribosome recycling factor
MEELELYIEEAKDLMNKALNHVGHELTKIRAGKANPSMLDGIQVSYYGAMTPLNQVSSMTTPDARSIFIKPWEKNLIQEIEKAIRDANLGLNPQNDGTAGNRKHSHANRRKKKATGETGIARV